jgi:hypothetical protein
MQNMTLAEQAPIACTLNGAESRNRRTKIAELNRTALKSHRHDGLRLELCYAAEARPQVLDMVRAEQTCCSFLTFEIREEPDALRVIVTAPERAGEAANSLFKALYSTTASDGASGFATPSAPTDRVVGASAALAATGALACGVCCVLPFALPATLLAASGGIIGWFAKATPWAMRIALLAVLGSWIWVILQSVRTKRKPAPSTLRMLGLATAVFIAAMIWWHFEREIIQLLR